MSERFFVERPITGSSAELVDAEAQHLSRVMRAAVGDEVVLFDASAAQFTSKITRIAKAAVTPHLLERHEATGAPRVELTRAVALPQRAGRQWRARRSWRAYH